MYKPNKLVSLAKEKDIHPSELLLDTLNETATIEETAAKLGVSVQSVRNYMAQYNIIRVTLYQPQATSLTTTIGGQ